MICKNDEFEDKLPSGEWSGYFLQPSLSKRRFRMEMYLSFRHGKMDGEGRDFVGQFAIKGNYDLGDGRKVRFNKRYCGQHDVYYRGVLNLFGRKGIVGLWEIQQFARAGFHIYPGAYDNAEGLTRGSAIDMPRRRLVWVDRSITQTTNSPYGELM